MCQSQPPVKRSTRSCQSVSASCQVRPTTSIGLNNVLILNLSEDICGIFGNENKVSTRFNVFLSEMFPPTVLAHPTQRCLLTELSPSQNHGSHNMHRLWLRARRHLKSTAART